MTDSASSKILNVAVIGCGQVAQCVHLPNLLIQDDKFRVTALCDISKQSLELCSSRFKVSKTYTSVPKMLSSDTPIDLVFILSADAFHAEQVILCANAGKHVLLEKPMAQTEAEADAIEEARVRNNVVVFIGYMRRYATALDRLKEEIKGKEIKYVRVRDLIGNNDYFTSQAGMNLKAFSDIPADARAESARRAASNLKENLGDKADSDPRNAANMALLGSLGSHDLSAMRDVLGMPEKCLAATRSSDDGGKSSWWWTALFQYKGFVAHYEMAIDQVALFDAHIEVYTNDSRVKIQYDTPYVKGLPIKLTIQSQLPSGDYSEQTIRPTYLDPYNIEMGEVYDAIVNEKDYKVKPLDAKNDLILAKMIMGALVN